MSKYNALMDSCDGDRDGLLAALGDGYEVVWAGGYNQGWGHHAYDTIYRTMSGQLIHAECGGCSCDGYGSWSFAASLKEAVRLIPDHKMDNNIAKLLLEDGKSS